MIYNILKLIFGTFLSRISGFFRELIYAYYFGASVVMDSWVVAVTIGNLLRDIVGEKVIEGAVIPAFSRIYNSLDSQYHKKFFIYFLNLFFWMSIILSLILFFNIGHIVNIIAPGVKNFNLAVRFSQIVIFYLIFITIYAYFGTYLLFFKKFFLYSILQLIGNLTLILTIIAFIGYLSFNVLPWSYLLSGFSMALFSILFFIISYKRIKNFKDNIKNRRILKNIEVSVELELYNKEKKNVFLGFFPILIETFFSKASIVVDRHLASLLFEGAISSLYYSFRLVQLPFALVSLAINRVVMIELTNSYEDYGVFLNRLKKGVLYNILFIIPIIIFTIIFSEDIVKIVYKRGNFNLNDVKSVSFTLNFYMLSLLGMSLTSIFSRALYVLQKQKLVLFSSTISLSMNIILNYFLYKILSTGGIALATGIAFIINSYLNLYFIYKGLNRLKLNMEFVKLAILIFILTFFILTLIFKLTQTYKIGGV